MTPLRVIAGRLRDRLPLLRHRHCAGGSAATSAPTGIVEQIYRAAALVRGRSADQPGVHGDGRAAARTTTTCCARWRCSATPWVPVLAAPDHRLDGGAGLRDRQAGSREGGRRSRARLPTWPSRSTPPPTRCATGSCRSTSAGRSRRCCRPPGDFPLSHGRRGHVRVRHARRRQRQRRRRGSPARPFSARGSPPSGELDSPGTGLRAPSSCAPRRDASGASREPPPRGKGVAVYIRSPRGDDIDTRARATGRTSRRGRAPGGQRALTTIRVGPWPPTTS